jgi:AcrR family transcriptional regulator
MKTGGAKPRVNEEEMKKKLSLKLMPLMKKNGVSSLKIDELSKQMDVSKATMYKYYASKDDIIESAVDCYIRYLTNSLESLKIDASMSYGRRFHNIFEESVIMATYLSDVFLQDLQSTYPDLYGRLHEALQLRNQKLRSFYESGIRDGVFLPINPTFYTIQDDFMFRKISDPVFLMQQNMTLRQAIYDYYLAKKHQLFQPAAITEVDDAVIENKLDYLVHKISMSQ